MKRLAFSVMPLMLACGSAPESTTYTLYRNSVMDSGMRVHIAAFDARDGGDYNQENCEQTRQLFQAQPGVATRFWCEQGRFNP